MTNPVITGLHHDTARKVRRVKENVFCIDLSVGSVVGIVDRAGGCCEFIKIGPSLH